MLITCFCICLAIFLPIAWFFPWVFVFHFGILVYFPYEPNGSERFIRVTGPLSASSESNWVSKDNLPKTCTAALVASEDTKFFDHHGIDFESLQESMKANEKAGKIRRGGSTISQQLIKNAFLSREKSYLRKVREISGAVLLDATVSKQDQIDWYFNIVEFGPKIYGIEQAAQHYFHKSAQNLTAGECVSLVAILPSPKKWNKSLEAKSFSPFFQKRYNVILQRMEILAHVPKAQLTLAQNKNPFSKPTGYRKPNVTVQKELLEQNLADESEEEHADKSSDPEEPSPADAAPETERESQPKLEIAPIESLPEKRPAVDFPGEKTEPTNSSEPEPL